MGSRLTTDPAAEIAQGFRLVPVPDMAYVDAKRMRRCSAIPADPASKVLDDDNLLIEILLRLGFRTTLVHAALVCKRWLGHASDPAFLRRFRKLHPPRLLGFYVNTTLSDLKLINFVPMLPQPPELAAIIRHATFRLDTTENGRPYVKGCLNGSVLVQLAPYRSSRFNVVHNPLFPERGMTLVPPLPQHQPLYTTWVVGHLLLKEEGAGLAYYYVAVEFTMESKKSMVHVYMPQDGVWSIHMSATTEIPRVQLLKPLLVDNKIYILASPTPSDILVLDLTALILSTIQLPQGVVSCQHFLNVHLRGLKCGGRTMLSRADDDSGVYLIHVNELQLGIWLHKGDGWLLVDTISLHEMCGGLKMSDKDQHNGFVEITKVGANAEFVLLKTSRCVLHWDVKYRTMRKVYEVTTEDYILLDPHPFMMIWPPAFPTLKDDIASDAA